MSPEFDTPRPRDTEASKNRPPHSSGLCEHSA